jgi:hypothetical protein
VNLGDLEFKRITLFEGVGIHEMGGMSPPHEQDTYMLYGGMKPNSRDFPQMRSRVGYDGIVPTIRLKALRDAIEDYEYLAILGRLGKSAEADKIVHRLTGSWFQWDKDPAVYEKARTELAALSMAESE